MPKYIITGEITISVTTYVEAETPERAKALALDREPCGHHFTRVQQEEYLEGWVADELDGMATPVDHVEVDEWPDDLW